MTTEITLRTDMDVDLIRSQMDDLYVVEAARVSVKGADAAEATQGAAGLIDYLMKSRHGSPFEHNSATWRISAPIFVWREFMRHRIGTSYNEESGRYKQLDPVFYVPGVNRKMRQVGKPGHYTYVPGTPDQVLRHTGRVARIYAQAYEAYLEALADDVAREVSRIVLPVAIYSTAYVTMNARSLMNFLSLRTTSSTAMFPSTPQREIEMVAERMEAHWASLMPVSHSAFTARGRVAP